MGTTLRHCLKRLLRIFISWKRKPFFNRRDIGSEAYLASNDTWRRICSCFFEFVSFVCVGNFNLRSFAGSPDAVSREYFVCTGVEYEFFRLSHVLCVWYVWRKLSMRAIYSCLFSCLRVRILEIGCNITICEVCSLVYKTQLQVLSLFWCFFWRGRRIVRTCGGIFCDEIL